MRILIVIILLTGIIGCSEKDGLPSGILKRDVMREVFWEVIQSETLTAQHFRKDSSINKDIDNAKLQQRIFSIHKINKETFYKSYTYYSTHVELMRSLLDSITTIGERDKYTVFYSKPPSLLPMRISLMPLPEPGALTVIPMPIPSLIKPALPTSAITVTEPAPPIIPAVRPIFKKNN